MHSLCRLFFSFFFIRSSTTDIYTLSLHDALPILPHISFELASNQGSSSTPLSKLMCKRLRSVEYGFSALASTEILYMRSEEHTSELQSRFDLVCRLLLEKKKYMQINIRL